MKNSNLLHGFIITTFVSLYLIVSVISTIHVIEFFSLSNPQWLSISLAIAFEIGAAASLASLIVLDKMNKSLVWGLFIILTCMQMMGNTYYAFTNLQEYQSWVELFGLVDEDPLYQKRILSIISGAILPIVALGFVKSLVDYIRPAIEDDVNIHENAIENAGPNLKEEQQRVTAIVEDLKASGKLHTDNHTNDEDEPSALANSEYRLSETVPFIEDALEMQGLDVSEETEVELIGHLENTNALIGSHTEGVSTAKKMPKTIAPANKEEILKEFKDSSEIDNNIDGEKKSLI